MEYNRSSTKKEVYNNADQLKKQEKSQTNNLILQLKEVEK